MMPDDPSKGTGPRIALVAATYRRPDALATLFRSLHTQRLAPEEFEVAVVVDGIDEHEEEYRTVIAAAKARARFRLVHALQQNAGQSVARNRAIGLTSAPWLCIVDDDMDLSADFLHAHVAALEAAGERAVVIGRVVPEDGWERQPLYESVRTRGMLELHEEIAAGTRRAQASALVTQNVSLPRALYEEVGGLDERLRLGEDTELGFRLEIAGARYFFAAEAAAVHRSRIGSYETWLARQIEYGRNAVYIYERVGRHALAHPLRNLVNGSRLNSLAVHLTGWSDPLARNCIASLRRLGDGLQHIGITGPAISTHSAILAVAYHVGVKEALGSWSALLREKRAFAARTDRPPDPT